MPMHDCLAGIFIGGQSKRMLGTPKGLLQPPGSGRNLVERLASNLVAAGISDIVLVGNHDAYRDLPWSRIRDSPRGCGPMAGLLGLVEHARKVGFEFVVAIACDMPDVDEPLLRRLRSDQLKADALAPRREHWEPLCARYRVRAVVPCLLRRLAARDYRMTSFLDALGPRCCELSIDPQQASALRDWDAPSDLPGGVSYQGEPYNPDASTDDSESP